MENLQEKVLNFESFLNDVLKKDLEKTLENRDKICEEVSEYLQIKNTLEKIKDVPHDEGLKTKIDLGCNFYVQANVPDTQYIYVAVGFGFFVQFTHDEAFKFIDKKVASLNSKINDLTNDAAKIKGNIKLVLAGLGELQNLNN